jgi:transcriptional regulator with XRE-family HTH domain
MKPKEIKAALILREVSQSEIARRLGIREQSVSGVISGKTKSARVMREVARVLGKPVREIWPGAETA